MFNIDDLSQYKSIEALNDAFKDCRACGLREQTYQVVRTDGDPYSPIMFVGMNPGFVESVTDIPLCGIDELNRSRCATCTHREFCHNWQLGLGANKPTAHTCMGHSPRTDNIPISSTQVAVGAYTVGGLRTAGQVFDDCIAAIGLRRDKIFITNTCLCKSNNGDPRSEHILSCARIKIATGRLVKPKVIVTLGSLATNGYVPTNKGSFSALRGSTIDYKDADYFSAKIVPTYHPSYILRMMLNDKTGSNKEQITRVKWEFFNHIVTALSLLNKEELKCIIHLSPSNPILALLQ